MLTLVTAVNEAIERLNSPQLTEKLNSARLTSVEERLCNKYLRCFIHAKERKIRVGRKIFFNFNAVLQVIFSYVRGRALGFSCSWIWPFRFLHQKTAFFSVSESFANAVFPFMLDI